MSVNKHIIDVKTKGAKKSAKQIKGVGGALSGMAKQAGIAAAAYFGTRALINGIKGSIDAFAKQELAEKKLEAALGRTSNKLLSQARAIQQVTMFGDEQVIEAQALIGSFVKEEEAIMAATKATLDLAAAKGMELTVAADLVSKTLGSSTNALSRYGIEVTGAVGSTERLESLTGNLAKVFGGQATAQAETLAGAMAQMSNAVGDAQESIGEALVPIVGDLADFLKIAAEDASNFIAKFTQTPLQRTIKEMASLGLETGELQKTLNELQQIRILEQLEGNLENSVQYQSKLVVGTEKLNDALIEQGKLAKLQEEFDLRKEDLNLVQRMRQQNELDKKQEEIDVEKETANNRIAHAQEQIRLRQEYNSLKEKEIEIEEKISEEGQEKSKFEQKIDIARLKSKGKINEEILKGIGIEREGDLKEALRNAWGIGQDAYKWGVKIGGPVLGAITGATGLSAGLAYAHQISGFATGADYVTSGPEMIMVGDNPSGQERVQVTPLGGDPNVNGPQGGGVNVTFNNPIMTQDFVENQLMDNIKESLRLGGDIGIN